MREFALIEMDHVSSSNALLLEAGEKQYPLGTALLAKTQDAGRGRAGRQWISEAGGLYLSVSLLSSQYQYLTLLGASVVLKLCHHEFSLPAVLRWPNDIYLGGRKLGGVLVQTRFRGSQLERAVLGIGWNISQASVLSTATTLSHHREELPSIPSLARTLLSLLNRDLDVLEREGPGRLLEHCESFLDGKGVGVRALVVEHQDRSRVLRTLGQIQGLGPRGELRFLDGTSLESLGLNEALAIHCPSSL